MRLVVDLETDGLLQDVTKIHCVSVVDADSSYSELFLEKDVRRFLDLLHPPSGETVEIIGHNIINYDLKVLEKLYGWTPHPTCKIHDTLILAQLLFSDLRTDDEKGTHGLQGKIFSKKDTGSHSLKAWGQRIMCYKGEYEGGWEAYNDDMGRYCIQDTYTTKTLFHILESRMSEKLIHTGAIDLEYSIAPILARQQAHGVLYDKEQSSALISTLTSKLVECKWKLQEIFTPRFVSLGEFTPKRDDRSRGYKAGCTFTKIQLEEFNPGSRTQIVDRLIKEFGWNPEEFTDKGNVKMDEDIIENLPFKELQPLKDYLTINKRISQIETGKQAWVNKVDNDGRIRGSIRQNGAVTGRMAHFGPNLAQVPANDSLYGKECRELFIAPEGRVLIGCDADALEMRCLAGYLVPYDGGRFRDAVLKGKKEDGTDAHTLNAIAYQVDQYPNGRDCAKTVFYGDIYGAKNAKKGQILMEYGVDFRSYVPDFDKEVEGMVKWVNKKNEELRAAGKEVIERTKLYWECWIAGKHCSELFGDKIPELNQLREEILKKLKEVGYVKGLDGRKLFCRSQHGALNTVLQSAGAIIMKKALFIADQDIQKAGLIPGRDYEFVLNVHDEWQVESLHNERNIAIIRESLENSIRKAGEFFNFPCPMKGNSQVGRTWAETH